MLTSTYLIEYISVNVGYRVWHFLRDSTFNHCDAIPECDTHTDRHTHMMMAYRVSIPNGQGGHVPLYL